MSSLSHVETMHAPVSTMMSDFRNALLDLWRQVEAARGDVEFADVLLQARAGEPLQVHAVVLYARCKLLADRVSLARANNGGPVRIDCEQDELLAVLRFLYTEALPPNMKPQELLCLHDHKTCYC